MCEKMATPFAIQWSLWKGVPLIRFLRLPDGRLIYRGTLIAATTAWGSWPSYYTASVVRAFLLLSLLRVLDAALCLCKW